MHDHKHLNIFLITVGVLTVLGIIMVYSSSYIFAKEHLGSSTYFFSKQLLYTVIGCGICWFVSRTKFEFWIKYGAHINLLVLFLLFLTFFPSLSHQTKGASRWLNLGGLVGQPGEFAKYTIMLAAISLFLNYREQTFKEVLLKLFSLGAPLLLILLQPDFGSFAICVMALIFVCFLSEFPRKWFFGIFASGLLSLALFITSEPYRLKRLTVFLDPWKDPLSGGFQIIQSFLAFANGSFWGRGIGNSHEKLFYLPEAHNDFIFSVIGEELGFIGVMGVILIFLTLLYQGFRMAVNEENNKASVLVASIVFIIGLQAAINMGVVLGLLPTKGLNLPFISSGGSSLLANYFAVGLIMSVHNDKRTEESNYEDFNYSSSDNRNPYFNSSQAMSRFPK